MVNIISSSFILKFSHTSTNFCHSRVVYYSQGNNPNKNKKDVDQMSTLKATIINQVETLEDEELLALVYSFVSGILEVLNKDNAST